MLPTLQKEFTFQYVSILIDTSKRVRACCDVFTFQYVSILILQDTSFSVSIIAFTFQYVSILITSSGATNGNFFRNLHSNMFLF